MCTRRRSACDAGERCVGLVVWGAWPSKKHEELHRCGRPYLWHFRSCGEMALPAIPPPSLFSLSRDPPRPVPYGFTAYFPRERSLPQYVPPSSPQLLPPPLPPLSLTLLSRAGVRRVRRPAGGDSLRAHAYRMLLDTALQEKAHVGLGASGTVPGRVSSCHA